MRGRVETEMNSSFDFNFHHNRLRNWRGSATLIQSLYGPENDCRSHQQMEPRPLSLSVQTSLDLSLVTIIREFCLVLSFSRAGLLKLTRPNLLFAGLTGKKIESERSRKKPTVVVVIIVVRVRLATFSLLHLSCVCCFGFFCLTCFCTFITCETLNYMLTTFQNTLLLDFTCCFRIPGLPKLLINRSFVSIPSGRQKETQQLS